MTKRSCMFSMALLASAGATACGASPPPPLPPQEPPSALPSVEVPVKEPSAAPSSPCIATAAAPIDLTGLFGSNACRLSLEKVGDTPLPSTVVVRMRPKQAQTTPGGRIEVAVVFENEGAARVAVVLAEYEDPNAPARTFTEGEHSDEAAPPVGGGRSETPGFDFAASGPHGRVDIPINVLASVGPKVHRALRIELEPQAQAHATVSWTAEGYDNHSYLAEAYPPEPSAEQRPCRTVAECNANKLAAELAAIPTPRYGPLEPGSYRLELQIPLLGVPPRERASSRVMVAK